MFKVLTKAAFAVLRVADGLLKNTNHENNFEKELRNCMDAVFLLEHANTSVSVQRKELLKPVLRNEYATLCDGNIPATSLLFGHDLAKSLKEARQVGNVGRHFQPKNGKRFWNRPRKEFGWKNSANDDVKNQKKFKKA